MHATPPAAAARQRARWCAVDGFGVFGGVPHSSLVHPVQRRNIPRCRITPRKRGKFFLFFGGWSVGREWVCTDGTDGTVISESPLRRAFWEISELSVPSVPSVPCVAPRREKTPRKQPLAGGGYVWSAVRRGLTQTGLPVQRACAGVSRASSARAYSPAACVCGDSPSRPSVARRWLR